MEQFFTDWWPIIVPLILALAKVANKVTKHWPQWSPYLRWLGLLVELLDLIRIPEIKKNDTTKELPVHPKKNPVLAGPIRDTKES